MFLVWELLIIMQRQHRTVIYVVCFYVNGLPTCLLSSYQSSVSLSVQAFLFLIHAVLESQQPTSLMRWWNFLFVCFFFPVVCSPACKWTCFWVGTSESVMRSWYELAQSHRRRRSAEVAAAGNADWNGTFGTKLYCEALYQLNRWMTMGFN